MSRKRKITIEARTVEQENHFNELAHKIQEQIKRRRGKWKLKLGYMDYDDVSQIIFTHIYAKWPQYDPKQPLEPWVNTIITNRMQNIYRDEYGNYEKPCVGCAHNEGGDLCAHTPSGKQCDECPLFLSWLLRKESAHRIQTSCLYEESLHGSDIVYGANLEEKEKRIHAHMLALLEGVEKSIYKLIYIEHKNEEDATKKLGYLQKKGSKRYIRQKCSLINKKIVEELKNNRLDI
ncbi:MAG: hypothetical protein ISP56_06540 [Flavobacteriaceae bacterium]|nr:hypothetical protein [Flavobacteriaceae bacterium]